MFRDMRRKNQQVSVSECIEILKTEKRGVLAVLGDEAYPYAMPMNFYYDEQAHEIYFHSACTGHKIDAVQRHDKACFTVWNQGYQKTDWSYYITSVIVMGRIRLIDTEDGKWVYAMLKKMGSKYFPTEQDTEEEIAKHMQHVQLLALQPEHMTGKLVHEK